MDNQQVSSTESFKDVPDNIDLQVDVYGNIRRPSNGRLLKPCIDKDGYLKLSYWCKKDKKMKRIFCHRAVALTYIPNPENKPQVNHKDSNRLNNFLENLEWCTAKENAEHCASKGRTLKGEKSPVNVYSEETIRKICELLEEGVSVTKIPKIVGVNKNLPVKIKSREVWVEISKEYNIPEVKPKMSLDVVIKVCELLQAGLLVTEIERNLNLGRGVVSHIKRRKTFTDVSKDYIW